MIPGAPLPARAGPPVTVLMATCRGATVIGAQLASIAAQTHGDWHLIVSDDGSTDGTRAVVADFMAARPPGQVRLVEGPGRGSARNFLHLLGLAPPGMVAFCDQDDVWFPDKLARAVAALAPCSGPAHYAARTIITDPDLNRVAESRHFRRPLGFRNALVQAVMAGNTTVLNAEAVAVLQDGAAMIGDATIQAHDWWAYQITAGIGATLIHDPRPVLLYRQHAGNLLGRNDTLPAMAQRFGKLFSGEYRRWLGGNLAALAPFRDRLLPGNRAILDGFSEALALPGPEAALRLRRLGLYRQTRPGTAALLAAAAMGRLRQSAPCDRTLQTAPAQPRTIPTEAPLLETLPKEPQDLR